MVLLLVACGWLGTTRPEEAHVAPTDDRFEEWATGIEVGRLPVPGGTPMVVVRVDPAHWDLGLYGPVGRQDLPIRQWVDDHDLTLAINAGMYHPDGTHVGFLGVPDRELAPAHEPYSSVLLGRPLRPDLPRFRLHDLREGADPAALRADYGLVVQNLRLIARPGDNRWTKAPERTWSEAALAEDQAGNMVFVLSESALTMRAFNDLLLGSGLGIVAAQHLDGGPPAQLIVSVGGRRLHTWGREEDGVQVSDSEWALPFVLGLRPR